MAAKLRYVGGSKDDRFNLQLAKAVLATIWCPKGATDEGRDDLVGAMAAAMAAFAPSDEIEGMIAAQAMALHHASMECSRRAMIPDQGFEAAREYRKAAANASRAFVELLAALDRKRGKGGQQKVTVEHVHVHAGGKAIVGAVGNGANPGGGGGVEAKEREEPHTPPARLAHEPDPGPILPPLRCEDADGQPVQIPRDGERALPNARRR